ncbi:MAG: hypothetical protein PQJ59_01255 [Spirochaetales bacterium]|nr:hypothetical protein [Spirochaetales bacterium]
MFKKFVPILLPAFLLGACVSPGENLTETTEVPLVELREGKLIYHLYANQGEAEKENILPDFSYAGYKGGGVALPKAEVVITLSPVAGDNSVQIQKALDKVGAMEPNEEGIRGAVLLTKGEYTLERTLYLNKDGVILRGEGQGEEGTILYDAQKVKNSCLILGSSSYSLSEIPRTRSSITSPFNGTGSREVTLASAEGYAPGDTIAIVRTPNKFWTDDLEMTQWGWEGASYNLSYERTVTAVEGDTISFDIPLVDTIRSEYGGGYVYKTRINAPVQNTGVESLRFESFYRSSEDEDHGWAAIEMMGARNCWVKNVTARYFGYSTVNISKESAFNTIQDCAYLDGKAKITGGRRYSFAIQKGTGNLFQRCYSDEGRHDFVTGSRVTGPNVFLDCYSRVSHNDSGPHHRWATGILFDNISTEELNVQNREDSGSGHGWAGAQIVLWNCDLTKMIVDAPKGAMNFAIGCRGQIGEGKWNSTDPRGYFYSHGEPVPTRSLYIRQLKDRLGEGVLAHVFTESQLSGTIYEELKTWAGAY